MYYLYERNILYIFCTKTDITYETHFVVVTPYILIIWELGQIVSYLEQITSTSFQIHSYFDERLPNLFNIILANPFKI
jgi:hypothetical protein